MACKLDHRHLHPQADAQIGQIPLPGITCRGDHALHAPVAEAAGDDQSVAARQHLRRRLVADRLAVDPADVHLCAAGIARVAQRFRHGEIGVVQLHIFSHQADGDLPIQMADPLHHGLPLPQLRRPGPKPQLPADDQGKILFLQHQRRLVEDGQGSVFDDAVGLYVAEHGDLPENRGLQRLVAAQHDNVRRDAHALQLLHGMLGGLGLVLVAAPQEGHQGHMNVEGVLLPLLQAHLTGGLQKGLALDIAGGAADLGDDHVRLSLLPQAVDKALDLLRDVRNHLHRLPQVLAPPLLVQHVPVDLPRGQVGKAVQILVDKALVVPQIQIRLAAVLGDIDLSVLIGAHGSRVHVDIGIQLLRGHLQPAAFEQPPQGRRRDALAQPRHHAAGDKNVFSHAVSPPSVTTKNVLRCLKGALGPWLSRTFRNTIAF